MKIAIIGGGYVGLVSGACFAEFGVDVAVYEADPELPPAVLVDIDGTVALMGGRSPYDMSRVGEDQPNAAVITAVRAMHAFGHHIVFCSGRTDDGQAKTERWLAEHVPQLAQSAARAA